MDPSIVELNTASLKGRYSRHRIDLINGYSDDKLEICKIYYNIINIISNIIKYYKNYKI